MREPLDRLATPVLEEDVASTVRQCSSQGSEPDLLFSAGIELACKVGFIHRRIQLIHFVIKPSLGKLAAHDGYLVYKVERA